ncbi:SLC13 family permease [Actinomadura sp. NPDC048955]|uniref:SLC13 family permease n=1 Tax=Actinomadura sp. NPDC048955 TaxID=3158228 RepID=UPI00340B6FF1
MAAVVIVVFVVAYVLIASEKIHRTAVALGGAGLMLLFHITDAETAFFSTESGVDWNVIFLLLGMMVIASVLRQTGVFEFVAIWAAKRARGKPYRLMVMLTVITALTSALLDNVTTVLLIAPVTFLVCKRLATQHALAAGEVLLQQEDRPAQAPGLPAGLPGGGRSDVAVATFGHDHPRSPPVSWVVHVRRAWTRSIDPFGAMRMRCERSSPMSR